MILKFQRSYGLSLPPIGRWKLEVWFCPRGEKIPWHRHAHMSAQITFLAGRMVFHKVGKSIGLRLRNTFKTFLIKQDEPHAADVTGWFGMFAVVERWTDTPTSASIDFIHT